VTAAVAYLVGRVSGAAVRDLWRLAEGLVSDATTLVRLATRRRRCPHIGGHAPCPPLCAEVFGFRWDPEGDRARWEEGR
jgi:hypothetical protein